MALRGLDIRVYTNSTIQIDSIRLLDDRFPLNEIGIHLWEILSCNFMCSSNKFAISTSWSFSCFALLRLNLIFFSFKFWSHFQVSWEPLIIWRWKLFTKALFPRQLKSWRDDIKRLKLQCNIPAGLQTVLYWQKFHNLKPLNVWVTGLTPNFLLPNALRG